MPTFCTSCGAPLTGPFCVKCGQRAQTPSAPHPPQSVAQPTMQPAAPPAQAAAKSSGFGKALLLIGGIVFLIFVMGLAATFYGVYRIKRRIATYSGPSSSDQINVTQGSSCALLSREDLQQVLGVTIEKTTEMMEGSEPGCAYYTNPAAFTQLQHMAIEEARKESAHGAQQPDSKSDNPLSLLKDTKDMEGMVKALGMTQPDKDGRVFAFTVKRDFGRNGWGPLRATMSAVPGFEDVSGVGDHAMIGSFGHAFYVLKGDSIISLETMYVPDTHTRGAELGRKIAARL